jgi:hypothetical protein
MGSFEFILRVAHIRPRRGEIGELRRLVLYDATESLPSLHTIEHFEVQGYQIDGPLFEGSTLIVFYRDSDNSKFVLKSLNISEAHRVLPFREKQPSNQHIISSNSGKMFRNTRDLC